MGGEEEVQVWQGRKRCRCGRGGRGAGVETDPKQLEMEQTFDHQPSAGQEQLQSALFYPVPHREGKAVSHI